MEKSYNFKMQMGCSVLSWAATLSLAFKAPEKIDDWMVIPGQ
jgi:hypothetical protein